EAISISDRIVALHAGEVKQIGAYAKIYSAPSSGFAADCVDSAYNLQKAVLSHENGVLTLCFDKNDKQTKLNASCFEHKILNGYIGKTVLVGCHADGFVSEALQAETEKVLYAVLSDKGYLHFTENGFKVLQKEKCDSVCTLPDISKATLFDQTNENSIML
ncbi:MAG: hypothetical protein RR405_03325, partial [Clostridia bacterium]